MRWREIGRTPKLESVGFVRTDLPENLFSELAKLPRLTSLSVYVHFLPDRHLDGLSRLEHLEELQLVFFETNSVEAVAAMFNSLSCPSIDLITSEDLWNALLKEGFRSSALYLKLPGIVDDDEGVDLISSRFPDLRELVLSRAPRDEAIDRLNANLPSLTVTILQPAKPIDATPEGGE